MAPQNICVGTRSFKFVCTKFVGILNLSVLEFVGIQNLWVLKKIILKICGTKI